MLNKKLNCLEICISPTEKKKEAKQKYHLLKENSLQRKRKKKTSKTLLDDGCVFPSNPNLYLQFKMKYSVVLTLSWG